MRAAVAASGTLIRSRLRAVLDGVDYPRTVNQRFVQNPSWRLRMNYQTAPSGPILRMFQVQAKPGRAADLVAKFGTTSAEVVQGKPGNLGYFFGQGVDRDEDYVVFTSVWRDLEAIQARFGDTWQVSYLPPGYEDLIAECSVHHIDVGSGWQVEFAKDT